MPGTVIFLDHLPNIFPKLKNIWETLECKRYSVAFGMGQIKLSI